MNIIPFIFLKNIRLVLLLVAALLSQQSICQIDKGFWFAAPEITKSNSSFDIPIVLRIVTFDAAANVTISMPSNPSFIPIHTTISAGSVSTVDLSNFLNQIENITPDVVSNKGIFISSTAPISVIYENESTYCHCNPEIFSLKGRNALGTEFIIPSQTELNNSDYNAYLPAPYSSFDIMATEDETTITITPSNPIVGHLANIPFDITLNAGQTYSAKAVNQEGEFHLQYSQVISDKPIAITIKDDLLEVYNPLLHANIGGDQLIPKNQLGTKYIAIKGQLNNNFEKYYIFASENNTQLNINGVSTGTSIEPGGAYMIGSFDTETVFIDATKPVIVLQVSGIGNEVAFDILPHIECTGTKEVGFMRTNSDLLYLHILVPTGGENGFTLNGNSNIINASAFITVPNTGNQWKYARKAISNSELPALQAARLKNNNHYFHASILHGDPNKGARFGYLSNFNNNIFEFVDTSLCQGSIILPGGTFVTAPGTYQELYQTSNTCDSLVTYFVISGNEITTTSTATICQGDTYTLPNGQIVNAPGTYTAILTASNGCDSTITTIVTAQQPVTTTSTATICQGDTYTLPNGQIVNTSGTYTAILTASNGCDSTINTILTVNQPVTTTANISICQGDTYTLPNGIVVSSGGTYQGIQTGVCDTTFIVNLTVAPTTQTSQSAVICSSSYTLPNGQVVSTSGIYNYTLQSVNGCDSIITANITLKLSPYGQVSNDTILEVCETTTQLLATILTSVDSVSHVQWLPSNLVSCDTCLATLANPVSDTVFVFTITNQNGCVFTDSVRVGLEEGRFEVYFPNAFMPGSQLGNNIYTVFGNKCIDQILYLRVWDYWGELLHESLNFPPNDLSYGWNGNFRNQKITPGTFVYTALVRFVDGQEKFYKGEFYLVR